MKFKDENGNWVPIILEPSGDTLPLGSIVEYDGNEVPYGYEELESDTENMKIKKIKQAVGLVGNIVDTLNATGDSDVPNAKTIKKALKNVQNISNKDLNTLIGEIIIGYGNNSVNSPLSLGSGYFINIPHCDEAGKALYNKQIWISRTEDRFAIRTQENGIFGEWKEFVNGDNMSYVNYASSLTLADGISFLEGNTQQAMKFNNGLVMLNLTFKTNKALNPTEVYVIATLPKELIPIKNTPIPAFIYIDVPAKQWIRYQNGAIAFQPQGNIPINTEIAVCVSYFIK